MAEEEHLKKNSRILIELNKSGLASLSKGNLSPHP